MPRYSFAIDLALHQTPEQRELMEYDIIEGIPIIYEMQEMVGSVLSERAGLSIKKRYKTIDKVFDEMDVKLPIEGRKALLAKYNQRQALTAAGCDNLQPKYAMIIFLDQDLPGYDGTAELLRESRAENFVLKHSDSTNGMGNIFLTRQELEECIHAGGIGELEMPNVANSRSFAGKKVKDIKKTPFVLEECINPSFDKDTKKGEVYRVALVFDTKDPENKSRAKILCIHHLDGSISSHDQLGSATSDFVDKRFYRYQGPNKIMELAEMPGSILLGERLRHYLFEAAKAYANLDLSREIDFITYKKPITPTKALSTAQERQSFIARNRLTCVSQLLKLATNIIKGTEGEEGMLENGFRIMLLDDVVDLMEVALRDDLILEKSKNFLHLLLPNILKQDLLGDFDSFYYLKKSLLSLLEIEPATVGKEKFHDYLLRSATLLKDDLSIFLDCNPLPSYPFDFPQIMISIGADIITYQSNSEVVGAGAGGRDGAKESLAQIFEIPDFVISTTHNYKEESDTEISFDEEEGFDEEEKSDAELIYDHYPQGKIMATQSSSLTTLRTPQKKSSCCNIL